MKTLRKIMMAFLAMACIGMTVACDKDDDSKNEDLIVGTWTISKLEVNGTDQSQYLPSVQVTLKSNGSGTINILGREESFTWKLNGDKLNVTTPDDHTVNCTVVELTSKKCTLTSSNMTFPVVGNIDGEVTIYMNKA